MDYSLYLVAIPVIVVVAAIGWVLYKRTTKTTDKISGFGTIATVLEPGWQLFPRLTSGEAPGTIFRINGEKQRFIVSNLVAPTHPNDEHEGKKALKTQTGTRTLVKLLGINLDASVGGNQQEDVVFQMDDSVREITTDEELDNLLKQKISSVTIRPEDRYFVIRETRATQKIDFEIKRNVVERLGGKVQIQNKLEVDATLIENQNNATFDLQRSFDKPFRIMFTAEEIHVKQGAIIFKGVQPKEFTHSPVTERLEFEDAP